MDKTNLEILYNSIKGFETLGVSLPKETLEKLDELEEELITSEVLPAITKDIEPRLSQIQRDIVLVVEYKPNMPISVSLSRKRNITELINAKRLEVEPIIRNVRFSHHVSDNYINQMKASANVLQHTRHRRVTTIAPKTGLCIYRKDGSILQEDTAAATFIKAVVEAGLHNVRELNLKFCGVNIVSTTKDSKYGSAQHETERGVYVLTHSSTKDKKKLLEKINNALNMGWRIEIVK